MLRERRADLAARIRSLRRSAAALDNRIEIYA
jgi:hypothetical protein